MSKLTTNKIEEFKTRKEHLALALELPSEVYEDYTKLTEAWLTSTLEEVEREAVSKFYKEFVKKENVDMLTYDWDRGEEFKNKYLESLKEKTE